MAQKYFIYSEEEHSMVQGMAKRIEQLKNENKTLREFNSKHRSYNNQLQEQLKSAYMETFRVRTNLQSDISHLQKQIEEMKRDMADTESALKLARLKIAMLEA